MINSTKHLLDQLINKVDFGQNNPVDLNEHLPYFSLEDFHDTTDNVVVDELQEILKRSLSELTFKNICHPHINHDDHSRTGLNDKSDKKHPVKVEPKPPKHLLNGKEDIKNLLYSHFPKYLNSTFRFKIGELAYLKWHDELCLVIINFASQKLLVSSDNDFDDNYDDQDKGGITSHMEKRHVWLFDMNEDLYLDADNHNLYSKINQIRPIDLRVTDYNYSFDPIMTLNTRERSVLRYYFIPMYYVSFPGYKRRCSRLFRFWVQEKDLIKYKSIKFTTSTTLPSKCNTISVNMSLNLNDLTSNSNPLVASKMSGSSSHTLPGSSKPPVTKNTRQKDANGSSKAKKAKKDTKDEDGLDSNDEKEERIEEPPKKGEVSIIINRVKGDKPWNKRKIINVNEYVYDVIHNIYNRDLVSGKYISNADFFSNYTPWVVPAKIKKIVVKDHKRIISYQVNVKMKFKYRKSIFCVVQNFKYLLLIIAKYNNLSTYVCNPNETKSKEESERKMESASTDNDFKYHLSQMQINSLASLRFLETCADGGSSKFTELYLNNFYWLDLLLAWIDSNFLNSCCYSRWEYSQISSVKKLYNRPLTKLLSFEYLCRILSFDIFYVNFLSRIKKNDRLYMTYLPIIQLLLYYMTFVADEYTNTGIYGIKTVK